MDHLQLAFTIRQFTPILLFAIKKEEFAQLLLSLLFCPGAFLVLEISLLFIIIINIVAKDNENTFQVSEHLLSEYE